MVYNKYTEKKSRLHKGLRVLSEEGFSSFMVKFAYYLERLNRRFFGSFIVAALPQKSFAVNGKKYPYFIHRRNTTWVNERAVEIPFAMDLVKQHSPQTVLEIGAVLTNYFPYLPIQWDVVDKFEKSLGIINADVIDYKPLSKYDLIVTISTLEHVGQDDDIKDQNKIFQALGNLQQNCLKKNGTLIVSIPLGYHHAFDNALFENKLKFDEEYYLQRGRGLHWKQIPKEQAKGAKYGTYEYLSADVVFFGVMKNS
ncbi:hypothetical protein J4421_05275 [Candidatus Woesearchaeota archaeon]|nr:hypothetical protein [Candidatus Woesearchaeota archaeon]